jgi:DNA-binding PadR family transcriptional regulator
MSIEYAILGILSWHSLTGYDLKKMFTDSVALYWSGNNNEIYKALVDLHEGNLVTREIQYQEDRPPRKIYSITDRGLAELRKWVLSEPVLPQVKHPFLIQLAWADQLTPDELDDLLGKYEDEVQMKCMVCRVQRSPRDNAVQGISREKSLYLSQARTPREAYLWDMIMEYWSSYYENELEWIRKARRELRQGRLSVDEGVENEAN